MTDLRTAAQQALGVLIDAQLHNYALRHDYTDALIVSLRAALAQQTEPVEPVGTVRVDAGEVHIVPLVRDADRSPLKDGQAVYAAPPQRKPLTQEETPALAEQVLKLSVYCDAEALLGTDGLVAMVRAVEQAHGIKE